MIFFSSDFKSSFWAGVPVGRARNAAPAGGRSHGRGWEDGQAHKKMRGLWLQTPRKCFSWIEG